jgi:HTH-type transcriptional regulator/antitoxin HigA
MPAEVFPPSEYLRDELTARGWPAEELARRAVIPVDRVAEILAGEAMTLPECERIGVTFGVSGELFARLQMAWRRREK